MSLQQPREDAHVSRVQVLCARSPRLRENEQRLVETVQFVRRRSEVWEETCLGLQPSNTYINKRGFLTRTDREFVFVASSTPPSFQQPEDLHQALHAYCIEPLIDEAAALLGWRSFETARAFAHARFERGYIYMIDTRGMDTVSVAEMASVRHAKARRTDTLALPAISLDRLRYSDHDHREPFEIETQRHYGEVHLKSTFSPKRIALVYTNQRNAFDDVWSIETLTQSYSICPPPDESATAGQSRICAAAAPPRELSLRSQMLALRHTSRRPPVSRPIDPL